MLGHLNELLLDLVFSIDQVICGDKIVKNNIILH